MRPSTLILSVLGIAAHLCSAGFATSQAVACDITSKLWYITKPGYDPIAYGNCDSSGCAAHPPNFYGTVQPVGSDDQKDLQSAFSASPPDFQNALCLLTAIYIDQDNNVDINNHNKLVWGMRVRAENGTTQIGINQQILLNYRTLSQPLTYNENYILRNLRPPKPPWLKYISADPDTREMAILSNLAHEMGHIMWWQEDVNDTQCNYWYFFELSSWATKGHPNNGQIPHGFHQFSVSNPPGSPMKTYSGDFASAFATVSVDEDFVETYKLWVLTRANTPLQHLRLAIAPMIPPVDIITQYFINANTILFQKRDWINTLFNSHQNCT